MFYVAPKQDSLAMFPADIRGFCQAQTARRPATGPMLMPVRFCCRKRSGFERR